MAPGKEDGTLGTLLEQTGALLADLCGGHSSTPELDVSLGNAWASYNRLRRRRESESLSVAVLALTKSGKSTLINALVGEELLPMNNVPETARICKVVHSERASQPFLVEPASSVTQQPQSKRPSHSDANGSPLAEQGVVTCHGSPAVRARLQELNRAVRGHDLSPSSSLSTPRVLSTSSSMHLPPGSPSVGQQAEGPPHAPSSLQGSAPAAGCPEGGSAALTVDRNMLAIHTHIAALRSFAEGGRAECSKAGSHNSPAAPPVRLHLLDTPGPNEAGEAGLRHQVERLLGTVDAAVYLLDYTKLKTEDEATMFGKLKEINPALIRRLSQRLFIVVNKVDASLVSEGQDADATREYVAELVTQQMQCEGFQLMPEQVLLLSARNALLARRVLMGGWPKAGDANAGGPAAAETRARFAQLAFGRFASPAAISPEAAIAAAHALLEDSGVPELEAQVLAHLYNYSGSVKQLALVDDLGRLLTEVRNMSASCAAALSATVESLEARTCSLREELTTTLQAFDSVHSHADAITAGVTAEVRAHLHTLRGRLFSLIISALDTSSSAPAALPPSSSWQRVRERFLSIFTTPRAQPVPGTRVPQFAEGSTSFSCEKDAMLAAAGAVVARSRSKSELAVLLAALHEDVMRQIHAEVTDFWSVLEAVAAARHTELLAVLNKHLQALSGKVEAAVSGSLDVKLEPLKLALAPQSTDQFHCSLEALIAAGVVESRERHIRVGQRQVHERVKRPQGGICRWGHYWEDVPRTRTVVEAYTMTVYEMAPTEITKLFISMVDSAISATESQLESYVSKFVGDQLAQARQQLECYSKSYLGTMTSALEVGALGAEHRFTALQKMQALLGRVDALRADVEALLNVVERGVPRARESILALDEWDELDSMNSSAEEAASAAATATQSADGNSAMPHMDEQQQQQQRQQDCPGSGVVVAAAGGACKEAGPGSEQARQQAAVYAAGEGGSAAVCGEERAEAAGAPELKVQAGEQHASRASPDEWAVLDEGEGQSTEQ